MATGRRRRTTSESTSGPDAHESIATVKLLAVGLVISLVSVYSFDLVSTWIVNYIHNDSNTTSPSTPVSFPWSRSTKGTISRELQLWMEENDLAQFSQYFNQIGKRLLS